MLLARVGFLLMRIWFWQNFQVFVITRNQLVRADLLLPDCKLKKIQFGKLSFKCFVWLLWLVKHISYTKGSNLYNFKHNPFQPEIIEGCLIIIVHKWMIHNAMWNFHVDLDKKFVIFMDTCFEPEGDSRNVHQRFSKLPSPWLHHRQSPKTCQTLSSFKSSTDENINI